MRDLPNADAMELSALLCSRICHDLASPIAALANGTELIEDEGCDAETRDSALSLIRDCARSASIRLRFCRLAFGAAAGQADQAIALADEFFAAEKRISLRWARPPDSALAPASASARIKLLLNLLLAARDALPRGGEIVVDIQEERIEIQAKGEGAAPSPALLAMLEGDFADSLDSRSVQSLYALRLAQGEGLALQLRSEPGKVGFSCA